jgi:regulator of sirC expression with transglutaminase-like and TPR domain
MNSSEAALHTDFSDSRKQALLKLLADEDPAIYRQIREKIVATGPQATRWLRQYTLSPDPVLRRRTTSIVRQFERHAADNEFVVFCLSTGQDLDLEQGVLLLSKTAYPDINTGGYSALLDSWAGMLRERLPSGASPGQTLKELRRFIFDELGFTGNEQRYYDPQNSYLSRVLDRRTGNPISLCTIYLLLARRLQLPISGIGLPGHFVCRYQTSSLEVYIDAFNKGALMTKADCIQYLLRSQHVLNDAHLAPVSTRRMLSRMCGNLQQIYAHEAEPEEVTRFRRYIVALSKSLEGC